MVELWIIPSRTFFLRNCYVRRFRISTEPSAFVMDIIQKIWSANYMRSAKKDLQGILSVEPFGEELSEELVVKDIPGFKANKVFYFRTEHDIRSSHLDMYPKADVESSYEPPSLPPSRSPSELSKTIDTFKPMRKKISYMPLFFHWFPIELYECFCNVDVTQNIIEMSINGVNAQLPLLKLKTILERLRSLARRKYEVTQGYFSGAPREGTETSFVATWLDRYLGSEKCYISCLHQLPSGGCDGPYKPDTHVIKCVKDSLLTILIGDGKPTDFHHSIRQTHCFAVDVMQRVFREEGRCPLIIGLPTTAYDWGLWIYSSHKQKLLATEICRSLIQNTSEMNRLLCTLYGAVHSLGSQPIIYANPTPFTFRCCNGGHRRISCNTFYCLQKNLVYKLYDTKDKSYLLPNVDLVQASNPKLEMKCGGRIQFLSYTFIGGDHVPPNLWGIIDAIRSLKKVHSKGYVHGDVRIDNVVFGEMSGTLIDFDFARLEGTQYPAKYNHHGIPERCSGQEPTYPMQKLHDRISLHRVITMGYKFLTSYQAGILDNLILEDYPLDTIIQHLLEEKKWLCV